MTLSILNSSVMTADGTNNLKSISLEEAIEIMKSQSFISAIGHQSTADILSELTGITVPMNRIEVIHQPGDISVIFKLNGRIETYEDINRDKIEKIGYTFKLMTRLE